MSERVCVRARACVYERLIIAKLCECWCVWERVSDHVSVEVCVCICVCLRSGVCMHVCACTFMRSCTGLCVRARLYLRSSSSKRTHSSIYILEWPHSCGLCVRARVYRWGVCATTTVSKETYYSVKRDLLHVCVHACIDEVYVQLLQCQKRPTTVSKETYMCVCTRVSVRCMCIVQP